MAYFEFPHTRSYEGDLGYIIKKLTELVNEYNSILDDQKRLDELYVEIEKLYNDIINGNFPESLKNALFEWMTLNAANIIARLIKNVYFGLTDAGYFVAYIPDSWQDITFKTSGYDYVTPLAPDFGHLILQY